MHDILVAAPDPEPSELDPFTHPRSATTEPLAAGAGRLAFARVGARTAIQTAVAKSPLKFLMPRNRGSAAWAYTSSYGGGLVGGDHLHLDVDVSVGAHAALMTQASTKVFRSSRGSGQSLDARVGENALLVLAPDPVTVFAAARYEQRQTIHLASTANLVLLDWLSCGRRASGERWAFDRYASRTTIHRGERRLLYESLVLDPMHGPLPRRMGRFNAVAMLVLSGPMLATNAREILESIAAEPMPKRAETIVSAGPLGEDGVLVRIAAIQLEEAAREIRRRLSFLSAILGDDPWARKW